GAVRVLDPPGAGADTLVNPVFTARPVRRVEARVTHESGGYVGVIELTGSAEGLGACGASRWRRNTYRVVELRAAYCPPALNTKVPSGPGSNGATRTTAAVSSGP